jgi:flagellar protein FliT
MTPDDVLAVYERIADLTEQMLTAARASDWTTMSGLEQQCAQVARTVEAGPVPPLSGSARLRKVALLTKILATDRAITEITEPWMAQLAATTRPAATAKPAPAATAAHH